MKVFRNGDYKYLGFENGYHVFEHGKFKDIMLLREAKVVYSKDRVVFFKRNGSIEQSFSSARKFSDWATFLREVVLKECKVKAR